MLVELVCYLNVGCMLVVTRVYLGHVSYVPDHCCESYILLAQIYLYYMFFKYIFRQFQKSTYFTYMKLMELMFFDVQKSNLLQHCLQIENLKLNMSKVGFQPRKKCDFRPPCLFFLLPL